MDDSSVIPDSFEGKYREIASSRYAQEGADRLRQLALQKSLEAAARRAPSILEAFAPGAGRIATAAGGMLSKANAITGAATTGAAIGGMAYDHMSPETQSTIGGTVNQAMRNFGGGYNDDAQMYADAQARMQRRAPTPDAAPLPAVRPREAYTPAAPYQGTLQQQYAQSFGETPAAPTIATAVAPKSSGYSGSLNDQFSQALGYNSPSGGMSRRG